jgi:hypothetical protein
MALRKGDHWGRLQCIGLEQREIQETALDASGRMYFTGMFDSYEEAILKCECGKVVKIRTSGFKGKKNMKDCGCGMGKHDGITTVMTITMPYGFVERIRKLADRTANGNKSQAFLKIVKIGLPFLEEEVGIKVESMEEDEKGADNAKSESEQYDE